MSEQTLAEVSFMEYLQGLPLMLMDQPPSWKKKKEFSVLLLFFIFYDFNFIIYIQRISWDKVK